MIGQPDTYLAHLYKQNQSRFTFSAQNEADWQRWQESLIHALRDDLGLDHFQKPAAGLQPKLIESVECDGYVRQQIAFEICPDLIVPAYLLLPDKLVKPGPAVLACHGHGYGNRNIVGLAADGSPRSGDPGYHKDFALELVKRGFIVIAPELIGFGDARMQADLTKTPGESSCHQISTTLMLYGLTLAGMRIYQAMCMIDYLYGRDDVDGRKIGCMGISGGGLVASFTSALDSRVQAAVVSGYTNTFKASIIDLYHCVDNYVPGILRHAELPDIIGLIAPRPLLIEGGIDDPIFPINATTAAADKISEIYRLLGAEEKIARDFFPGEHQIGGAKAYPWLVQRLS